MDKMSPPGAEYSVQRRVTGHHDLRLDGIGDLVSRARGASVFDVGCNRGMAGYEFACNGARLVHGCDSYETGIKVAREVFADIRNVESRFEVVDLTGGEAAIGKAFGDSFRNYDMLLILAIYHKLKRVMQAQPLNFLMQRLASRTNRYIGWRGYAEEVKELDALFAGLGFKRIQYSEISETICPAAIWRKGKG